MLSKYLKDKISESKQIYGNNVWIEFDPILDFFNKTEFIVRPIYMDGKIEIVLIKVINQALYYFNPKLKQDGIFWGHKIFDEPHIVTPNSSTPVQSPNIWRTFYCPDSETQAFRLYPPDGASFFKLRVQESIQSIAFNWK